MTEKITTALIDDQELVRLGFRMVIEAQDDMVVVAEAGNGQAAVELAGETPPPDVILMDVRMPGLDGVEATRRITASRSATRVLILTTFDADEYMYGAILAGASGFLLKDCGRDELVSAIRHVHEGDAVMAPSATRRLIERISPALPRRKGGQDGSHAARLGVLSAREREVMTAIGQGLTNAEIADALSLAQTTVKTHVRSILTKLDLRDRIEIVILAYDAGLVLPAT